MSKETKKSLFEDAIAEAKAIKEMAIENAKDALKESLTPHLQSMVSKKIQEMENEENLDENENIEETEEVSENEEVNETEEVEESTNKEKVEETSEINLDELLAELTEDDEQVDETEEISENVELEEKKGRPKKEETEDSSEENEEDEEEVDLDEMSEKDLKKFIEKVIKDMVSDGELESGSENGEKEESEDEEEVSIDEILASLNETDEESVEESNELEEIKTQVEELQNQLNEVNLLNSKLLYTNKIFRNKNLNESQKIKVLNSFDKAKTVKESKIVYETLMESFKNKQITKTSIKENLGSASKTIIKPIKENKENPIIDNDVFARMRKLAGLK